MLKNFPCQLLTLFTGFLLAMFLCCPSQVQADVFINEIFPAPTTGKEWVEFWNSGPNAVDMSNWYVQDEVTTPTTVWTFANGTILEPHQFIVIEIDNKLNNTGDGIILNNAAQQRIEFIHFTTAITDRSYARIFDGGSLFQWALPTKGISNVPVTTASPSPTPSPTPTNSPTPSPSPTITVTLTPTPSPSTSPTPSPTPTAYPTHLEFSEIMACPQTGDPEWIEIYNPSAQSYTLSNWRVRDGQGNTRLVNTVLPSQGYGVVLLSSAMLNNDGDKLSLERPDGVLILTTELDPCVKGQSFIWRDDHWEVTTEISKGQPNPSASSPTPIQETDRLTTSNIVSRSSSTTTASPSPLSSPPTSSSKKLSPKISLPIPIVTPAQLQSKVLGTTTTTQENSPLPSPISFSSPPAVSAKLSPFLTIIPFLSALIGLLLIILTIYLISQWYTEQHYVHSKESNALVKPVSATNSMGNDDFLSISPK